MSQSVPESTPAPEAAPEGDRHELKREIIDFVKLVVWFLVIFLGLRTYVIEGYEVQGPSMEPTLQDNERILVLKFPHILSRFEWFRGIDAVAPGDIVVFDSPDQASKRYVKRVIAKGPQAPSKKTVVAESHDASPAQNVKVEFNRGEVFVNNKRLEESYIRTEEKNSHDRHVLELGPGEYYVLGDHRSVSKDSRSFEAIEDERVIGKAILRFWPPRKISLLR